MSRHAGIWRTLVHFSYDEDSKEWTRSLLNDLRALGHDDVIAMIHQRNHELEEAVRDGLRNARLLVQRGQLMDVLVSLSPLSPLDRDALVALLRTPNGIPSGSAAVAEVLTMRLDAIEKEPFRSPVPLNVLASLDVLFHLLVVPRRCLEQTATVLREKLRQERLLITDENGDTLCDSAETLRMAEEEAAFWAMADEVQAQWNLSDISARASTKASQSGFPIGPEAALHDVLAEVLNRVFSEREPT